MIRLHLFLACVVLLAATQATSAQTRQDLKYDDLGRVSQVSFTQGAQRLVIHYEYDNRNNITRKLTEVVSSVDEHSPLLTLTVAPNPSSNVVRVHYRWQPDQEATVLVTDATGVVRHTEHIRTDITGEVSVALDTRKIGLASGSYTVTLACADKLTSAPLVVVR